MLIDTAVSHGDWFNAWGSYGRPSVYRILDQCRDGGIRKVHWRTFHGARANYHSKLEPVAHGSEDIERPGYEAGPRKAYDLREWDPLRDAVDIAHELGLQISAWYTVYEETHVQRVTTTFAAAHPEYWWTARSGKRRPSKLAVAVPTAVYSAMRPGSWMDWAGTTIAVCGMAIPGFWLGIILIYVFAVWHHWLPPSGYIPVTENPQESLRRLILPGLTVASWLTVPLMRQLRASLIEVLQNDYIRTARSKGLADGQVLGAHALRNALIPVLTVLGGMVGHLYAGTVIGETIFSIPGLGKLVVDSISFRDFPVTQGVVLLAAGSVLLATLITDVLYALVDPRVRYS